MSGSEVLLRVELPCALPLILSGVRAGTLQCIATSTVSAYVSLGGFGRFVVDGLASRDFPQMAAGAVLVAALALAAEAALLLVERAVVSPGVSGRFGRQRSTTHPGSGSTANLAGVSDDSAGRPHDKEKS